MFSATVYAVSELRARHLSINTIRSHLRAIAHFEIFCGIHRIDLKSRLDTGRLLSLAEVDALVQACRIPTSVLKSQFAHERRRRQTTIPRTSRPRERVRRMPASESVDLVVAAVAHTRLKSILRYVDWVVRDKLMTLAWDSEIGASLESTRDRTIAAAKARLPAGPGRNHRAPREGLPPRDVERLLEVTDPDSSANPWAGLHTRIRNALIIWWFYQLGLRRGELLNVRIPDIDFQAGTVDIVRRPHDASDPRRDQPLVKTRERRLPINPNLLQMTMTYVMKHRRFEGRACYDNFLFVASRTGAPLSIVALGKIFQTLKEECGLPRSLCPHILRHTWNDDFSDEMDRKKIPEEQEKKIRALLMGWSETSDTSAIYTRRHTRRRATEASLALQTAQTEK